MSGQLQNGEQQFIDANGNPLDGGTVDFYIPNTTTRKNTWQDQALTILNTNPIVLDAAGRAVIWGTGSYRQILKDKHGNLVWDKIVADPISSLAANTGASFVGADDGAGGSIFTTVAGFIITLKSSIGASLIGFIQSGVGAVLRFAQDKLRETVSVTDFGAKGNGVNDDTTSIQQALNTGKTVYFPAGTYYITADLTLMSGQLIHGDGYLSQIQLKDGSINGFVGTNISYVTIRDLRISIKIATNATAYKAAINLVSCGYCLVDKVYIDGMGYDGIRLYDTNFSRISRCLFMNFFGTVQDQADIAVMNNSGYNLLEGNGCYGGGDHGILVQDPYTGATPTANKIVNNDVGTHKANGILIYVTTAYDTQTIISSNRVSGILGTALSGQSGAGIYIQSAGGSIVNGNQVSSCCQQTTSFSTQGVGHISVAIGTYGTGQLAPVIVANNHINAPRGPGIWCATSNAPIIVEGNTVMITSIGSSDEGRGIYAVNCQGARIGRNTVTQSNPNFQSIQVTASATNVSGADISDNFVKTVAYGIAANIASGGTLSDITVKNNRVYNGNQTGMTLEKITNLICSGNDIESTGLAFTATSIVNSRYTANRLNSSLGGYGVIFTGTGSNNIVDESNYIGNVIENDATSGTTISQYGTAAPAMSGLWANGDRVIARFPSIGNPKGWRCTSAGNPGTWTSEGNL